MRRRLLALVVAALVALAGAGPAFAQDNTAIAINDQDGTTEIDISFAFHRVMNGIVDQSNAAVAFASCEECETIAIAIQLVLVAGDVETVTPTNLALAWNQECTACVTMAIAYQWVWGDGTWVRFTHDAARRLRDLAKAFHELEKSGGTPEEITTRVNELFVELEDVLSTGLEPAPGHVGEQEAAGEAGTGGTEPTATPEPTATAGPAPSRTPEPTATTEPTPSPTPEGSATPEPTAVPLE